MRLYFLLLMIFVMAGCVGFSDSSQDTQADSALGLAAQGQDDSDQAAQEALLDNQKQQQEEQKRLLSRQITDPLA